MPFGGCFRRSTLSATWMRLCDQTDDCWAVHEQQISPSVGQILILDAKHSVVVVFGIFWGYVEGHVGFVGPRMRLDLSKRVNINFLGLDWSQWCFESKVLIEFHICTVTL